MRRLRDDLNSRLDDGKSEDEAAMVSGAVMVMVMVIMEDGR
ncbi:unnamed protein product [Brugia pahangi]|uniref:TetR family transcriptional regulator n=1 Tax=Brugia pahangi TaxID=6280 RepID=A0A0N4TX32_BRUPA|nr:unnamed protein product [Brugia pahangi]